MNIFVLALSADSPELSHEEIERQLDEFERELAAERPRSNIDA